MTPYELLVKARGVFATRGGAKGQLVDMCTDQVCALGALNVAVYGSPYHGNDDRLTLRSWYAAKALLDGQVMANRGNGIYGIVDFNNAEDTVKDDVLTVFDQIIVGLEEKS